MPLEKWSVCRHFWTNIIITDNAKAHEVPEINGKTLVKRHEQLIATERQEIESASSVCF